jgi:hypothetical protein
LTERGVALVVVVGLMIATAALAVISLTALRVTSERYEVSASTGAPGGQVAWAAE